MTSPGAPAPLCPLVSSRPNIGGHRNWFCRKAMLRHSLGGGAYTATVLLGIQGYLAQGMQRYLAHQEPPPCRTLQALCLGTYGDSREVGVSN